MRGRTAHLALQTGKWSGAYARAEQLVTPDELKGALTTAWARAREIHVKMLSETFSSIRIEGES